VGRDIIRLKFPSNTQPTQPLIIANPDYNLTEDNAITSADTATQNQGSIDTVYSDLRNSQLGGEFEPIPGTALESVEVSRYLGVTPQTEKNALESLVKSQLSPRILHIATHSYFLTIEHLNRPENKRFFQIDTLHRAGLQNIQNPLLRAGLAFAGANTALNGGKLPEAAEDGILTAQDVATLLDLRATELVVLSACESGLGEVKLGESVHGLRHAFLQAGAKSLMVSLWAVNDISTAILMGQFYHYYLEDKLPIGKALEQAKRYVRNLTVGQMRDTWLTDEKIEYVGKYSVESQKKLKNLYNESNDYQPYKHPKYWAAFICLGLAD
jgi:CHAT domain-containing protein